MRRLQIGVIGPALEEYPQDAALRSKVEDSAEEAGRMIAKSGAILITGGADGVMEAASRGAKQAGGTTIGTPGRMRGTSNEFVDIEILTPIDVGDFLFAGTWSCDAFIVIPASAGTMAEMCLAYRLKKPIIVLKGISQDYDKFVDNYMDEGKFVKIYGANTPQEAVELALKLSKVD